MDYGKIVRLTFDEKVWHVSNTEKSRFRLINVYEEYVYPISVTYGANDHEVYLHFTDINTFGANRIECLETVKMGSEHIHIEAFVREIFLDNLIPCDLSHIEVSGASIVGEIAVAFDGKAYFADNYLNMSSLAVAGQTHLLTFCKRYLDESGNYVNMSTLVVAGQYCDINGTPL